MDTGILGLLKTYDKELKTTLNKCSNLNEAWQILKKKEKELDERIYTLEKEVDSQRLLNELHRYNFMKDSAQSVIGSLASVRGITVAELHREFNSEIES